jgi:recombination protein RecR
VEYASHTLERMVEVFSRLPGIGPKSAQRIALYLLKEGRAECEELAKVVSDLAFKVKPCSVCFNLTEADPCAYCTDPARDRGLICVVEEPKDLLVIERTGSYRGRYHVLGGSFSPLDGVGEAELKIKELLARLTPEVREVIVATNPTLEGEMTASHLARLVKTRGVKASRIARGIPFGGALEFNDAVTVAKSVEGRVVME